MMNIKLKTLVVAVAMAAAGAAQASVISVGGYSYFAGPTGLNDPAGGSAILTVYDPGNGTSIALNTNKTVLDMVTGSTGFTITDPNLTNFITTSVNQSNLVWNMGAVADGPGLTGVLTTNGNAGAVWNPAFSPLDGFTEALSMDKIFFYAGNNNGTTAFNTGNSFVGPATASTGFGGGSWGSNFGGAAGWGANFDNTKTGLNSGMTMSFIAMDPNNQDLAPIATTLAGTWSINATTGSLSYTTVPVPAAVWLFGSGLLGLVGIGRRKKA